MARKAGKIYGTDRETNLQQQLLQQQHQTTNKTSNSVFITNSGSGANLTSTKTTNGSN